MKYFPPSHTLLRGLRGGCLVAVLLLCRPKAARAEDSLTYKFQSWKEDNGRIGVTSHYAQAEQDFGPDTHFSLMGLIDNIAGATPTGELPRTPGGPTPLAHMEDQRRAVDSELSHQFKRVNVTAGYGYSRESDYISRGVSLNTVTDFNDKNTTLLLGDGHTTDTIMEKKLGWTANRYKVGNDAIIGFTQLLDPNTSITGNITYGTDRGYLADPYKIVSTTMLALDPGTYYTPPENRPRHKSKVSVFLGMNRNYENLHGAADLSYRYYTDSFGIRSHTLSVSWVQDIGEHFVLQPWVRFSRQGAADFYYYNLDQAHIVTTYDTSTFETGTGQAPFYSSDSRLSRMDTLDLGLKLTWKIKRWLAIDVSYDRYTTRGLDGITPQDAYYKANNFIVGVKLSR
ncbi:MAG: DUF3570 domain-containing protein [Opitutales bacterium]